MQEVAHLDRLSLLLHAGSALFLFFCDPLFLRQELFAFWLLVGSTFVTRLIATLSDKRSASPILVLIDNLGTLEMDLLLLKLEPIDKHGGEMTGTSLNDNLRAGLATLESRGCTHGHLCLDLGLI